MARQIIKQPNGKYAVWSSIVENFLWINCNEEELVKIFLEGERERIKVMVAKILESLEKKEKPYYQFTLSWNKAVTAIRQLYGKERAKLTSIWGKENKDFTKGFEAKGNPNQDNTLF